MRWPPRIGRCGRGSFTTITNFLRRWEEENKHEPLTKDLDIPEVFSNDADMFVRKIWMMAIDAAELRVQGEREALRLQEAEMNSEMEQAVEMANANTERYEALQEGMTNLKAEKEQAQEEIRKRDLKLQLLDQEMQALKAKNAEMAQNGATAHLQMDKLQRETVIAETRLQAEIEERTKLQPRMLELEAEIRNLEHKLSFANGQLSLKDKHLELLEKSLNEERKRNRDIEEVIMRLNQAHLFQSNVSAAAPTQSVGKKREQKKDGSKPHTGTS